MTTPPLEGSTMQSHPRGFDAVDTKDTRPQPLDWTPAEHAALMRHQAAGLSPAIIDYNGRTLPVYGFSRWDEGLYVSEDGLVHRYAGPIYGVRFSGTFPA
jgi:hypothetical protein